MHVAVSVRQAGDLTSLLSTLQARRARLCTAVASWAAASEAWGRKLLRRWLTAAGLGLRFQHAMTLSCRPLTPRARSSPLAQPCCLLQPCPNPVLPCSHPPHHHCQYTHTCARTPTRPPNPTPHHSTSHHTTPHTQTHARICLHYGPSAAAGLEAAHPGPSLAGRLLPQRGRPSRFCGDRHGSGGGNRVRGPHWCAAGRACLHTHVHTYIHLYAYATGVALLYRIVPRPLMTSLSPLLRGRTDCQACLQRMQLRGLCFCAATAKCHRRGTPAWRLPSRVAPARVALPPPPLCDVPLQAACCSALRRACHFTLPPSSGVASWPHAWACSRCTSLRMPRTTPATCWPPSLGASATLVGVGGGAHGPPRYGCLLDVVLRRCRASEPWQAADGSLLEHRWRWVTCLGTPTPRQHAQRPPSPTPSNFHPVASIRPVHRQLRQLRLPHVLPRLGRAHLLLHRCAHEGAPAGGSPACSRGAPRRRQGGQPPRA